MQKGFIIAIDGPLASGKGTVAKKLAHVLGGIDLYTGAMYRCLAYFCINNEINLKDVPSVTTQLKKITIEYKQDRIYLNGTDVTQAIQDEAVAEGASVVGVIPEVRKEFVKKQQILGRNEADQGKIVVVEGRDIGTVVFPDAAIRIYLTATESVRAQRRFNQYHKSGDMRSFAEVLALIKKRDKRDTERSESPLTNDPGKLGYFVLDNSTMNLDETVNAIVSALQERKLLND